MFELKQDFIKETEHKTLPMLAQVEGASRTYLVQLNSCHVKALLKERLRSLGAFHASDLRNEVQWQEEESGVLINGKVTRDTFSGCSLPHGGHWAYARWTPGCVMV